MISDRPPQVLVAGAGPVGLFTALALARKGVAVEIVDTGVWACKHSYALAIHPQALALFQEMGLEKEVLRNAHLIKTIGLYDGSVRRAEVRLDGGDPDFCLAVVRQDFIEDLLENALREHGVEVKWRHQLSALEASSDHVKATVDKLERQSRGYIVAHTEWVIAKSSTLEVPFVIGADGHNSAVRRALDFVFPEVGPAQYYAVFEFATDMDLGNELRIFYGDRTADVVWPLPNGNCRWGFELPDFHDKEAEDLKERLLNAGFGYFPTERQKDRVTAAPGGGLTPVEEEKLHALLSERAPWFKGSITNLSWHTLVRFERRLASSFGHGRMWLAGDSAHLTGPVGIQSMNLGFFEGADLASALAGSLRGGGPADQLGTYGQKWLGVWRRMQGLEGGLQAQAGTDPWVARQAAGLLSCLPAHGAALTALAGQLKLRF